MKTQNIFKYILFIFISSITVACSNDDNETINLIEVEDNSFIINDVIAFERITNTTNSSFRLYFLGSGVSVNTDENLTGSGAYFTGIFISNTDVSIQTGEYTYQLQTATATPLSLFSSFYDFSFSDQPNTVNTDIAITSGTITISREGTNYNIAINLIDINGKSVTGNYFGPIPIFESPA